jgi:hypothetical protein
VPDTDPEAARMAGALAGLAGVAAFLVIHHFWITPIWFIAPIGALMAAGGGAVVGTAYAALLPRLPKQPWRVPTVALVFGLVLTPAILLAEQSGPVFAMGPDGSATLLVSGEVAIRAFGVDLVGTSVLSGALIGLLVGRTRRAAAWTALAGLVLALGPGHNVPFLGGSPAAAKGVVLLLVVLVVATITLVEAHARLVRMPDAAAGTVAGAEMPRSEPASSP